MILDFGSLYNDVTLVVLTICHVHNERNKNNSNGHSCRESGIQHGTVRYVAWNVHDQSNINILQQITETIMINLAVTRAKTMTSFWNMSSASAPIHITATSVK